MFGKKFFIAGLVLCLALSSCAPSASIMEEVNSEPAAEAVTGVEQATITEEARPDNDGHHSDVDLTRLEIGDGKYSSQPQTGYVFSCMTTFNGGGASGTGAWINGDSTWNATKKITVDGSVNWDSVFTISLENGQRVIRSNDLPDHPTGNYPISPNDDAYAADTNPNSIQEQSFAFTLPANPTVASQPNCVGGEVGIMLSGVLLFSAFDALGRDAAAHEVQDGCDGHPERTGAYHYHSLSNCLGDNDSGHSELMGYAFDGFGIYGYYGDDGSEITNADLDECHGHAHAIKWDGEMVEMYHYHATHEFPYLVGCFKGTPAVRSATNQSGQEGQTGTQPQNSSLPTQGGLGQPPQAALDACMGLTQGAACTVNTSNGTISGTCGTPPSSSQFACLPAGGPPPSP